MTRNFDGTNDNISFGSDASIDNFTLKSVFVHFAHPAVLGQTSCLLSKSDGNAVTPTGWEFDHVVPVAGDTGHLSFFQDFTVTDGMWTTAANSVPNDASHSLGVVYDRGASGNNPTIYSNASSLALTTTAASGASNADAAQNLRAGENDGATNDARGDYWFLVYDNTLFTAADANRHRWWGMAPGGPSTVDVCIPMWTGDLKNKGTAGSVADGTASGTTTTPEIGVPVVMRPGCGGM